eukprot:8355226-Pyramimonas_sp.AAC.1
MEAGPRPRRTRSPCWGSPALLEPKVAAAAERIPRARDKRSHPPLTLHCPTPARPQTSTLTPPRAGGPPLRRDAKPPRVCAQPL